MVRAIATGLSAAHKGGMLVLTQPTLKEAQILLMAVRRHFLGVPGNAARVLKSSKNEFHVAAATATAATAATATAATATGVIKVVCTSLKSLL